MWIDYDVRQTARRCAVTDRAFSPGEEFFSVLVPPEDDPASDVIERRDLSREAWQGPPEYAIAWWRARMPGAKRKARLAPNEVMLDLFDRWADDANRVESRYVLTLLLIRRRVLKLHDSDETLPSADDSAAVNDETSPETITVYCSDRETSYQVVAAAPDDERVGAIQSELYALLYDGQPAPQPSQPADEASDQAA